MMKEAVKIVNEVREGKRENEEGHYSFKVGDLVWMWKEPRSKLSRRWRGPGRVIEVRAAGDSYLVHDYNANVEVSVRRGDLKRCHRMYEVDLMIEKHEMQNILDNMDEEWEQVTWVEGVEELKELDETSERKAIIRCTLQEMESAVELICQRDGESVLVIPHWPEKHWYQQLMSDERSETYHLDVKRNIYRSRGMNIGSPNWESVIIHMKERNTLDHEDVPTPKRGLLSGSLRRGTLRGGEASAQVGKVEQLEMGEGSPEGSLKVSGSGGGIQEWLACRCRGLHTSPTISK